MNKIICIDDTHRPNEISSTQWIKKGNKYTVVKMCTSKLTGDKYFVLEEVQPPQPWGGYNIKRFGIDVNDLEELVKTNELQLEEI
jgi:hypothetical protein